MRVLSWVVLCSLIGAALAIAAPTFDRTVAPPRALDGLRAGMTVGEAKAALATFAVDDKYTDAAKRTRLLKDAGNGAHYYVLLAGDVISRIGVEAPAAGLTAKLTKLWGAPARVANAANEALASWSQNEWRADLSCRGALCRMAFHHTLSADFFGTKVAPPAALSGVRLGMTNDQLAAIAAPFAAGTEVPAGPEDVRMVVDFDRGRVRSVGIGGLPATAGALLTKAWGPSTDIEAKPTWFDPSAGWRARYDADLQIVQLTEYMPVVTLLGPGDKLAAPLLGFTDKQLAAAYPRFMTANRGAIIALPPTEFSTANTSIAVDFDAAGRATQVIVALPFDTAAHRAELVAALEAKWGKSVERVISRHKTLTFPTSKAKVSVIADDTATALLVELR
jgi:hypothetical protein